MAIFNSYVKLPEGTPAEKSNILPTSGAWATVDATATGPASGNRRRDSLDRCPKVAGIFWVLCYGDLLVV